MKALKFCSLHLPTFISSKYLGYNIKIGLLYIICVFSLSLTRWISRPQQYIYVLSYSPLYRSYSLSPSQILSVSPKQQAHTLSQLRYCYSDILQLYTTPDSTLYPVCCNNRQKTKLRRSRTYAKLTSHLYSHWQLETTVEGSTTEDKIVIDDKVKTNIYSDRDNHLHTPRRNLVHKYN